MPTPVHVPCGLSPILGPLPWACQPFTLFPAELAPVERIILIFFTAWLYSILFLWSIFLGSSYIQHPFLMELHFATWHPLCSCGLEER